MKNWQCWSEENSAGWGTCSAAYRIPGFEPPMPHGPLPTTHIAGKSLSAELGYFYVFVPPHYCNGNNGSAGNGLKQPFWLDWKEPLLSPHGEHWKGDHFCLILIMDFLSELSGDTCPTSSKLILFPQPLPNLPPSGHTHSGSWPHFHTPELQCPLLSSA